MRNRWLCIPLAAALSVAGCASPGSLRPGAEESGTAPAATPVGAATTVAAAQADQSPVFPVTTAPAAASLPMPVPAPATATASGHPGSVPPRPVAVTAPERYVSLNFDNADISVVIQTIAELLRMNYIVGPTVRGRITIQSTDKLPVSALLPVLEQVLAVNNFSAVKSGDFYKIVPANQAKQESVETVGPDQTPTAGTGLVTKILRLSYISPNEVVKILTPFKTPAGFYQAHEQARLLFLTESQAKIAELVKIVEVLDVDTFASIQVELYPVRYAGVEELARELTQIVTMVYAAAGRGRSVFRIVPVTQANALMVFSAEPGLSANIREWIDKLDQPASEANERIFVYPLSHATAETLAAVIEKVFRRDADKRQAKAAEPTPAPTPAQSVARPGQPQPAAPRITSFANVPATTAASEGIAASGAAPVTVVADKDTNMLIIQTASWFYPTVEEMIRKLDQMPKQVLIEVLIAEISLDDSNKFGIQWALKGQGAVNVLGENHNVLSTTQAVFDAKNGIAASVPGFSFFVTEANRITAAINAYAKDSKLNILSAPHILATNNKEAKIDVGAEIPILKTRTTGTAGGVDTSNTVTNDIEYRNTGIILTVTPHVNEGGYVTLDLQQEVSEAQKNELGGTESPIIRKRTAKTTMVVKDDQTLVVGGLIQEKRDNTREGLPGLSKIPILGYLFGSTGATVSKTELVLLITPRVINNVAEGDQLTRQVKGRVLTLKKGLESFRTLEGGGVP